LIRPSFEQTVLMMVESAPSTPGSTMLGGLRRRASSMGHVSARVVSADHGRAHPRGGPRGGAPRQRRRIASSARRAVAQRSEWNDDTRTAGLFDVAFVRPSRLADSSVVNRSSFLGGVTVDAVAKAVGSNRSGASVSGRSTPGRSPRRSWATFHQSRLPASVPHIPEPYQQDAEEDEQSVQESLATNSDLVDAVVGHSSMRMPFQVPSSERIALSPGPVQLEVMHIQRSQEDAQRDEDVCIVLPDGTSLGVGATIAANSEHETVIFLPGGSVAKHGSSESVGDEALSLEKPVLMSDKARSVSEKLSALLGRQEPPPSHKQCFRSTVSAKSTTADYKMLGRDASFVLRHVDDLVNSVFDHILCDTVSTLNSLPQAISGGAVCSKSVEPIPAKVVHQVNPQEKWRDEIVVASERLCQLEQTLTLRYAGNTASRDIRSRGARLPPAGSRNIIGSSDHVSLRAAGHIEERIPASLSLEQVRDIEKYRTRFAHHCLAAREVGIDRSGPGDAASVATWTIWPHIADAIALAVVESAIEEVHQAMERHVEDLVAQEVGPDWEA